MDVDNNGPPARRGSLRLQAKKIHESSIAGAAAMATDGSSL
jgi:hypothetical protein